MNESKFSTNGCLKEKHILQANNANKTLSVFASARRYSYIHVASQASRLTQKQKIHEKALRFTLYSGKRAAFRE